MSKQYISLIFKTNLSFKFRKLSGKLQNITKPPQTAEKTDIDEFYRKALTDAPQMKDEIILSKVKSYLESNSRLVLHQDASDEEKTTAVLTIQRIIQILGESLKPSVTENCVVSYLLCSCLPLGWEESFTKARNFLSHLKGNSIQVRFKTEKDLELFMEIQKQLSVINTNFEIVYLFQKQRINKFFLRCGLEAKQNFSVQYDDQLKELDHEYTPKYIQLLKRYIYYLKFCIDTCYYIKLSKSFGNKFLVLCGLIKNIQEYSHESSSNFLIDYEKCHEMLSLLQAKESLNCSRHEKPTISDTIKEFKNVLCTLENSIDHVFPLHEIQNFSDDLNSIIEVYLEKSINIQNFVEDEKMSIIKMSEHIYEEMKSTLKVTTTSKEIQKNELEKLLPSFIFDQKLIQKVKLNVKDTKTIGIALEKCCFAWHTLKSNLENFLDKNVLEHRGCRMLLLKVCSPVSGLDRNLKKKLFDIMNQKMEFLFKRIHFIKQILIDQDGEISHYFQWGRTLGLKYHTKYLMVQRYRKDMEVRASLEMLLFDCSNLFKRKDLEDLWKKTEHLLAGINIGDILAHGNVVLDTIGTMLDPNDLPNELVEKMIELVKDGELISEMLKFFKGKDWYESKEAFRDALTQKEIFRECPRLDSYIELLPYP